jgi:hypothetical protein
MFRDGALGRWRRIPLERIMGRGIAGDELGYSVFERWERGHRLDQLGWCPLGHWFRVHSDEMDFLFLL